MAQIEHPAERVERHIRQELRSPETLRLTRLPTREDVRRLLESPFAAGRLRTAAAKRFKKVENATAVIWKRLLETV
jgi:hypothetical protein